MTIARAWRGAALAVAAGVLVSALPGPHTASADSTITPGVEIELTVPASNGYRLQLRGWGGHAMLTVSRGAVGDTVAVTYYVPAIVTARRLAADLGAFGRVDLRFDQAGRARRTGLPRRCRGAAPRSGGDSFAARSCFAARATSPAPRRTRRRDE